MTPEDIVRVARGLSDLERELLLGTSKSWGSWMWGVSGELIRKGLFVQHSETSRGPSAFGEQVRSHLQTQEDRNVI